MKGTKIGCIHKCDMSLIRVYPTLERNIFKNLFLSIGEEYFKEKYKESLRPTYPITIDSKLYEPNILEYRLDLYILTPDEFKYARNIEREYFELQEKYNKLKYRMEKLEK